MISGDNIDENVHVIKKTLKTVRSLNKKLRKKLSRSNVSKQTFNSETQTDETSLNSHVSNFTLNNLDPPQNTSEDSPDVDNIIIFELPSWTLKDKMSFFQSKQDYLNTPDTYFMNTTQEDTSSNPLLNGIFHLLSINPIFIQPRTQMSSLSS